MIQEIIKDKNMSADFESMPILSSILNLPNISRKSYLRSLAISWHSVVGTLNGKFQIYAGNKLSETTLASEIIIDTADNLQDCNLVIVQPLFAYIKIKYIANGITAGKVNISAFYSNNQE